MSKKSARRISWDPVTEAQPVARRAAELLVKAEQANETIPWGTITEQAQEVLPDQSRTRNLTHSTVKTRFMEMVQEERRKLLIEAQAVLTAEDLEDDLSDVIQLLEGHRRSLENKLHGVHLSLLTLRLISQGRSPQAFELNGKGAAKRLFATFPIEGPELKQILNRIGLKTADVTPNMSSGNLEKIIRGTFHGNSATA